MDPKGVLNRVRGAWLRRKSRPPDEENALGASNDTDGETLLHTGRRRASRLVASVIVVATLSIVVVVIARNWDELRALLADARIGLLAIGFVLALIGQALNVKIAHVYLLTEGRGISYRAVYRVLSVAALAKYVPGVVWEVGSQIGLGQLEGLKARQSVLAWIEPTAFNITVGAGFALLAATRLGYDVSPALLLAGASLALIVSTDPVRYRLYRLIRLIPKDRPRPTHQGSWIQQFLIGTLVVALSGLGGLLVISAFNLPTDLGFLGSLTAFVGAWVVGVLVFPVPGGIGIREGVLILALSPWLAANEAFLVAAASRLVATAAELVSGLIGATLAIGSPPTPVSEEPR